MPYRYFPWGQYHKKGENLDLDTLSLLTTNLLLREWTSSIMALRNRADTEYRDLIIRSLMPQSSIVMQADAGICSFYPNKFYFGQYEGGVGWHYVANIVDKMLNISRCGDVTLMANRGVNLGGGFLRVPGTARPTPLVNDIYYSPIGDTLWIFDGTDWKAH